MYMLCGLVALTMAIIHFLPKLTTAIPSSLAAIVVVSLLVIGDGAVSLGAVDLLILVPGI